MASLHASNLSLKGEHPLTPHFQCSKLVRALSERLLAIREGSRPSSLQAGASTGSHQQVALRTSEAGTPAFPHTTDLPQACQDSRTPAFTVGIRVKALVSPTGPGPLLRLRHLAGVGCSRQFGY